MEESVSIRQTFASAFERFGDLGFDVACFAAHLRSICLKHDPAATPEQIERSIELLHGTDLYLCLGCARQNARAWQSFADGFHAYIGRLAAATTESEEEATELTDAVIVDLYLPDRSGRSRIASFDGRSSLGTWLRVLVSHRGLNQRKRSRHCVHGMDRIPETADDTVLPRLDAELRHGRYGEALQEALRRACASLSGRERLVLQSRFCEGRKVQEIAARLQVHPSNVSRQIDRVCERLRSVVIRTLGERYHLSHSQIEECLSDVVDNPRHSILALLEETSRPPEPCSAAWPPSFFI